MNLLKTILVYLSMVFAASVQTAPQPDALPDYSAPTPTPYVEAAVTATPTPVPTSTPTPVPTINITPNPEYKTLQVGDKGDEVRELQEKLTLYGYYDGDIDGRYGNQTRRAVERFQYQHGLSVDGIAGRHTQTVLYESSEVRRAPVPVTPEPTATVSANLSVALTPAPSESPTEGTTPAAAPVETPFASFEPVRTSAPVVTATPSPTPAPQFMAIPDGTLVLAGEGKPLTRVPEGKQEAATVLPYINGSTLYLPLFEILNAASYNVISTSTVEMNEYAFATGSDIIRITHTETRDGQPTDLTAYRNNTPQLVPTRDIRLADGMLYLPADTIESLTGIAAALDADTGVVTVTMPASGE